MRFRRPHGWNANLCPFSVPHRQRFGLPLGPKEITGEISDRIVGWSFVDGFGVAPCAVTARYGAIPSYTGWLALTFKVGWSCRGFKWPLETPWTQKKYLKFPAELTNNYEQIWLDPTWSNKPKKPWHKSGKREAFQLNSMFITYVFRLRRASMKVPALAKGRFALFSAPESFEPRCPDIKEAQPLQMDWDRETSWKPTQDSVFGKTRRTSQYMFNPFFLA